MSTKMKKKLQNYNLVLMFFRKYFRDEWNRIIKKEQNNMIKRFIEMLTKLDLIRRDKYEYSLKRYKMEYYSREENSDILKNAIREKLNFTD